MNGTKQESEERVTKVKGLRLLLAAKFTTLKEDPDELTCDTLKVLVARKSNVDIEPQSGTRPNLLEKGSSILTVTTLTICIFTDEYTEFLDT